MISIIVPCKKRLKHLKATIKRFINQTYKDKEVIIVDYNCPENTIGYVLRNHRQAKVIRADVGENDWNLSASRNLGYRHSQGEILLFLDADTLLNIDFLARTIIEKGTFITGNNYAPHEVCGCCMVWREDFEKVKGYNEAMQGWGSEDIDLYQRLQAIGLQQKMFNLDLIRNYPHPHTLRNQFHGYMDIHETDRLNQERRHTQFKGL